MKGLLFSIFSIFSILNCSSNFNKDANIKLYQQLLEEVKTSEEFNEYIDRYRGISDNNLYVSSNLQNICDWIDSFNNSEIEPFLQKSKEKCKNIDLQEIPLVQIKELELLSTRKDKKLTAFFFEDLEDVIIVIIDSDYSRLFFFFQMKDRKLVKIYTEELTKG